MEAELWLNGRWPQLPIQKRKNLFWNNEWATPFDNCWVKQWNSTSYWPIFLVPGYDGISVYNLENSSENVKSKHLIKMAFNTSMDAVSVEPYCTDNGALLYNIVWQKLIFSECCLTLVDIDLRDFTGPVVRRSSQACIGFIRHFF